MWVPWTWVALCHMDKAIAGFTLWFPPLSCIFQAPPYNGKMWVKDGGTYSHQVSLKDSVDPDGRSLTLRTANECPSGKKGTLARASH